MSGVAAGGLARGVESSARGTAVHSCVSRRPRRRPRSVATPGSARSAAPSRSYLHASQNNANTFRIALTLAAAFAFGLLLRRRPRRASGGSAARVVRASGARGVEPAPCQVRRGLVASPGPTRPRAAAAPVRMISTTHIQQIPFNCNLKWMVQGGAPPQRPPGGAGDQPSATLPPEGDRGMPRGRGRCTRFEVCGRARVAGHGRPSIAPRRGRADRSMQRSLYAVFSRKRMSEAQLLPVFCGGHY